MQLQRKWTLQVAGVLAVFQALFTRKNVKLYFLHHSLNLTNNTIEVEQWMWKYSTIQTFIPISHQNVFKEYFTSECIQMPSHWTWGRNTSFRIWSKPKCKYACHLRDFSRVSVRSSFVALVLNNMIPKPRQLISKFTSLSNGICQSVQQMRHDECLRYFDSTIKPSTHHNWLNSLHAASYLTSHQIRYTIGEDAFFVFPGF